MHKQTDIVHTRYSFGKHLIGLVLLFSFVTSFLLVYAAESPTMYKSIFYSNFEQCAQTGYYTSQIPGRDWSYIAPASRVQAVGDAEAIQGQRSLQIQQCDIRWEDFKAEDYAFRIAFSIRLDDQFNQNVQFILSTQDTLTELSSEVGILLEVYNDDQGNAILQGSDMMTPLAQLKKNETYHIELFVERGSSDVGIALNGTLLAKSYSYISKVYFIDGFRVLSTFPAGVPEGGSWYLDDVSVATGARTFAQPYSGETPGVPTEVTLPDAPSNDLQVYVNGIQIGVTKTYASSQTVYISAEQFFKSINVPYVYDKEQKILTIENERISARVAIPDTIVTVNDSTIELTYPVRMIDQIIMISPQFINEVFNAKVWWDPSANLLVITTGAYKNNNQLMRLGSELYMNGEPYYSMGAYVPDLFQVVMKRYLNPANVTEESWTKEAESALSTLKAQGVNAVRFSSSTDLLPDLLYDDVSMGKYLEAMDALLNVCDRYGVQVVICFDLISPCFLAKENAPRYGWLYGDEHIIDLVSNPMSKSRLVVYQFLEKFVTRYEARNSILMYEISNGGNLHADTGVYLQKATYSLGQLAAFYQDCAAVIRKCDTNCILSSGDAAPLLYQWSLYNATMQGRVAHNHSVGTTDTEERQLDVLWLLHGCFDIVSVQFDTSRHMQMNNFFFSEDSDETSAELLWYIRAADRFDKPLYSGLSYGLSDTDIGDMLHENSLDGNLYQTVLSGIPLSFWQDLTPQEMAQGTQLLKATYANNIADAENSNMLWLNSNIDIFDPDGVISGENLEDEHRMLDSFLLFVVVSVVLIAFCAVIVLTFKNKKVV